MTFLEQIEQALARVHYPGQPAGLYEPISYALSSGGKRLRPVLLLTTYALYRSDVERALPAALAIETYHNHTLLHDDLMDHADMRRGRPTVAARWGANTAVLSGDTMLIGAMEHLCALETAQQARLFPLFLRTMREVCEGQQLDMNFESRTDVSLPEYLEMIRLKTSVLLALAAQAGAVLAGAPERDVELLREALERVGLAFQVQDDLLDCFGDPAVFGKRIGGDILCGKKTFLLVSALAQAGEPTRRELLALLSAGAMEPQAKIAAVLHIYKELALSEQAEAAISAYYAEAHELLSRLSVPAEGVRNFADALLARRS